MTTSHLPTASVVLAVGVDLMTDLVSQRGHVSTKALRSDLGTRHLEVATKPDLSGRTSWRRQSRRTADLRLIATNSQIWASSAWTNPSKMETPEQKAEREAIMTLRRKVMRLVQERERTHHHQRVRPPKEDERKRKAVQRRVEAVPLIQPVQQDTGRGMWIPGYIWIPAPS